MDKNLTLNSENAGVFVPPVLQDHKVQPTSCHLNITQCQQTKKTQFTYSLKWEKENDLDQTMEVSTKTKSKKSKTCKKRKSKKCRGSFRDLNAFGKCIVVAANLLPPAVACDGPCGNSFLPTELDTMGRCGHYLCDQCRRIVRNTDGSMGCSAFECTYLALFDSLPREKAKTAYDKYIRARVKENEKNSQQHADFQPPKQYNSGVVLSVRSSNTNIWDQARDRTANENMKETKNQDETDCTTDASLKSAKKSGSERRVTENVVSQSGTSCTTSKDRVTTNGVMRLFSDQEFMNLPMSCQLSNPCEYEVVDVRLMIFEREGRRVRRIHLRKELPGNTNLQMALFKTLDSRKSLLEKEHSCPVRVYFCPGVLERGMNKIRKEHFEKTNLCDYPMNDSAVHFVLDAANFVRK